MQIETFRLKRKGGLYYGGSSYSWTKNGGKVYHKASHLKNALSQMDYYMSKQRHELKIVVTKMDIVDVQEMDEATFREVF